MQPTKTIFSDSTNFIEKKTEKYRFWAKSEFLGKKKLIMRHIRVAGVMFLVMNLVITSPYFHSLWRSVLHSWREGLGLGGLNCHYNYNWDWNEQGKAVNPLAAWLLCWMAIMIILFLDSTQLGGLAAWPSSSWTSQLGGARNSISILVALFSVVHGGWTDRAVSSELLELLA